MYQIRKTNQFKRSLKRYLRSGRFDSKLIQSVIDTLARGETLAEKYRDHQLSGKMKDSRECHIKPDLLLIYRIEKDELILVLLNLGSHSELFG